MRNQPTILEIRPMSKSELAAEGWEGTRSWHIPYVIEVSDGSIYYPASDTEGNEPGTWFGLDPKGEMNIHDEEVREKLVGKIIIAMQPAPPHVMNFSGWNSGEHAPASFSVQGGITLYPSQDDEGNGPGAIFGIA